MSVSEQARADYTHFMEEKTKFKDIDDLLNGYIRSSNDEFETEKEKNIEDDKKGLADTNNEIENENLRHSDAGEVQTETGDCVAVKGPGPGVSGSESGDSSVQGESGYYAGSDLDADNSDVQESQEHLEVCRGTEFERRGLGMEGFIEKVIFWRRMTVKMRQMATAT